MYFWKVNALADDLKADRLSEKEKMIYFFLSSIVTVFFLEFSLYMGQVPDRVNITSSILNVLVNAAGLLFCYQANKKGDNKAFIERIICLSVPIGVRVIIASSLLYIVYLIGFVVSGHEIDSASGVMDVLFGVAFEVIFYIYLGKSLYRISRAS